LAAPSPIATAANAVYALAAIRAIPRAAPPWRAAPERSRADPTVRKAAVVRCHVTWIIALVVRGPPKRVAGNVSGGSFLMRRISPPAPWRPAPRIAMHPAMISGTFTPRGPVSERELVCLLERNLAGERVDCSGAGDRGRRAGV
jgi:hypothetical protein